MSSGGRRVCLAPAMLVTGCLTASLCQAQAVLDALGRRLSYASTQHDTWAQVSFSNELTVYRPDDPAPGLLFSNAGTFVAPRLSLSVDAGVGRRFRVHALARADRGFDPGVERSGDVRLDQYFVQVNFEDAGRTQLRVGRFATAFGAWVDRHLAWDNPLITAPALYEDMVTVTDQAAPANLADFLGRRDVAENKRAWVPVVWGPSYATGASLSTGWRSLDVTVEVKNAALSSRPETWDVVDDGFRTDPTFTGRVGWHPGPAWTVGASFSRGPYLQERAEATLPSGTGVDDFHQTTAGLDLTYGLRDLQLWAELVDTTFEVPRVGDVDVLSGFVEARYKFAPRWYLAGRWNQSWFDDIPGLDRPWDRDLQRLDLALGFRHNAHVEATLEYSTGDQAGTDSNGNELLAARVVVWF